VIDRVWPDNVQTLRSSPGVRVLDTPAIEAQRWIFQLAKDPVKDPASGRPSRWPSTGT
jgi:hypothetical protein